MKIKLSLNNNLYIIFLSGIIIGTICANFFVNKSEACANVFGPDIINNYYNVQMNKNAMFKYVLEVRLKEIFALIMVSFLPNAKKLLKVLFGVVGGIFAFVESVIVMQYSANGITLFFASIFPQFIIYVFAMFLVIKSLNFERRAENAKHISCVLLICVALYVLGAWCESTINYELVKKVLKMH